MPDNRNIRGANQLARRLKALGPAASGKALRSATVSAALPIVKRAKATAPRRAEANAKKTYKGRIAAPGFLSRNIGRKSFMKTGSLVRVIVGPTAEAYYGTQFVERGTKYQRANPWLFRAFRSALDEVDDRLQKRLRALLDKAAKT